MYEEFGMIRDWMKRADYDLGIDNLLQKYNLRNNGYVFTKRDHCEALILSILSANRPWIGLQNHLEDLRQIFGNYEPDYLISESPNILYQLVTDIGCGNRRLGAQMNEISYNVSILNKIEETYGNVDFLAICAQEDPIKTIWCISDKSSKYKLMGVGPALAAQYLKNIGIDLIKPDIHIRRIIQRFGWTVDYPEETETIKICKEVADLYNITQIEVGATLWQFCAVGYLRICGETPMCDNCPVSYVCNYGKFRTIF